MAGSSIKNRISNYFRRKRDVGLRNLIASTPRQGEKLRIIDLGGSALYWQRVGIDFLKEQNVEIELVNIEKSELKEDDSGFFKYTVGNACQLEMDDNSYDICHSNSVIEHVGSWSDMLSFAKEVRRIAPSHYIQTPNYWFPIDPHFASFPMIHWMPPPVRARLMQWFPIATAGKAKNVETAFKFVDSSRLLTVRQMKALFPDSGLSFERLLLVPKSIIVTSTNTSH